MAEKKGGSILKHIIIPIIIAIGIIFLTGMNPFIAVAIGFALYFLFRFISKFFRPKPPELVFRDNYEDIKSEIIDGSKKSCPPGDFKAVVTGSRISGVPAKHYGDIIGMVALRRYTIVNKMTEKPKGFTDYDKVTETIKGEKGSITKKSVYKFYDDVVYGMVVISTSLLGKMHVIAPLDRISPLSKYTIINGTGFKCIDKKKKLYVLQWDEKDDVYDEIDERVLQDSLFQSRNIEMVNIYSNAVEIAAKMAVLPDTANDFPQFDLLQAFFFYCCLL